MLQPPAPPVVLFDHGDTVSSGNPDREPGYVAPTAHPALGTARISRVIAVTHLEVPAVMPTPENDNQARQRQRSREASRRWRETHPDAYHAAQKWWQESHRDQWNAYHRAYRQRQKQDEV